MKRTGHSRLRHRIGGWLPVLALALACGLSASCDTEETATATSLPEGSYPLQMTAGLMQPQPRADGKGTWTDGTAIAVRMGSSGAASKYLLNASDTAVPATAADVLYWQSTAAEVTAWYPYTAGGKNIYDISDQSGGYEGYYILSATAVGSYDKPVSLPFYHQLAKVEVTLNAGDGITAAELAGASVTFFGEKFASVTDGTVGAAGKSDDIILPWHEPNTYTFEAVLVPQNMQGNPLLQVNIGGKEFVYTPATDAAGNLESGKRYSYAITVKANGIEVTEATGSSWINGGEENVVVFKAYTAAERGDYLLKDGRLLDKDKLTEALKDNVAAIVFWTPKDTDPNDPNRKTPASLTDDKVMAADFPHCTHGLAVSVKDFPTPLMWQNYSESVASFQSGADFIPRSNADKSDYRSVASNKGETDNINYILGYQNTQVLRAYNAWCTQNNRVEIVNALDYYFTQSDPAPTGSTGWFIPSPKELHILFYKDVDDIFNQYDSDWTETRDIVNSSLSSAGGDTISEDWYWFSTEYEHNSAGAINIEFYSGCVDDGSKYFPMMVRAVCAF